MKKYKNRTKNLNQEEFLKESDLSKCCCSERSCKDCYSDYNKCLLMFKKWKNEAKKDSNSVSHSCQIHPEAIYNSRLLDYKNLPEPQNSKEINEQFWGSWEVDIDFTQLSLDNNTSDWIDIHSQFTPELFQLWKDYGFNYSEIQEWTIIHFPSDQIHFLLSELEYYAWLRDEVKITPDELLELTKSEVLELKKQFQELQLQANTEVLPKQ